MRSPQMDTDTQPVPTLDDHGFRSLGAITAVHQDGNTLTLTCGPSQVQVRFLSDTVLRLRLSPAHGDAGRDFSYAIDPEASWPGPTALSVEESDNALSIRSAALTLYTEKVACRFHLLDAEGTVLAQDAPGPSWEAVGTNGDTQITRTALTLRLRPEERLLGLGDKPFSLDRRGHRLEHWNTDAYKFQRGSDPIYKSIPFVLGLHEGAAYGLFVDAPGRTVFDLGAGDAERLRVETPGAALDYYLFGAATPLEIVRDYTRLTGRQAMLPKWALGYHQCRYSYRNEAEIREVARELRDRRIPCDVLYFDIHYMDGYRVFTWDQNAFPDHAALLGELRQDGFRSVVIIDPGVKADDPTYTVAQEGLERGAFVTFPDGTPFIGNVWPGPCYFPDYTNPSVRMWWGTLHQGLIDAGVDGVWNDMNEPAVFSIPHRDGDSMESEEHVGTMPDELRHDYDGHGADHAEAHNVYGMQMLRSTYEGLHRLAPGRRPFTITRAAYAGAQRFGTAWTGDNTASWDHLKLSIQQCVSLNTSGMAFVGADVGGFSGIPDGELMARWTQVGALTPLFRNHSAIDTPNQEPWRFGDEVERVCREAIELRMQLLPYLYTVLFESATEGLPILRALPLLHPDDETIRRTSPLGFYIGESLLAHPILEPGQRSREVYLPAAQDGWYEFYTGRRYGSRSTIWVDTPLDHLPLFVRAGTVLAQQPILQHTGEKPVETLTLRVFPRTGSFASRLFEDEGDGWGFQDGEAWLGTLHGERDGNHLRLTTTVEGSFVPSWTDWRWELYGFEHAPTEVLVNGVQVAFEMDAGCVRLSTGVGATVEVKP